LTSNPAGPAFAQSLASYGVVDWLVSGLRLTAGFIEDWVSSADGTMLLALAAAVGVAGILARARSGRRF
jgi:hypothetical protein